MFNDKCRNASRRDDENRQEKKEHRTSNVQHRIGNGG